jgi:cephalosporin hydroxylase
MNPLRAEVNPIRDSLRKAAYRLAPQTAIATYLRLRMLREVRQLVALSERSDDIRPLTDELLRSYLFRPLQKRSEILRLLEIIRAQRPANVCEVGAAGGGTAMLFARAAAPDATLISIDLAFNEARREAVTRFALPHQRVVCIEGDSHNPDSLEVVRSSLRGGALDLLYLDGDHSYQGVAADFQMYAPLVRRGGLIVFHDIVPDFRARYGKQTSSDVGDVPKLWQEIKTSHSSVEEIIEDEKQDGFGIGVLHWAGPESVSA